MTKDRSNHETPGEPASDEDKVWVLMTDLYRAAPQLRALRDAMRTLSDQLPPRVSLRQALTFVYVADANAAGRRVTMRDVRDFWGEGDSPDEKAGQTVGNTFSVFLDDERKEDSLGWIEQRIDRDDRRRKFLHLTFEGKEMALAMSERASAGLEYQPIITATDDDS